jgi:hypothetical protein
MSLIIEPIWTPGASNGKFATMRTKNVVVSFCLIILAACGDGVSFHLTDLSSAATGGVGLGQSLVYRGTVLALGRSSVADNIYNVVLKVSRR